MRRLLSLAILLLATGVHAEDAKQPNVLFLFADDMRADSIAALGNPAVKTPHLDTLVRRGFAFRNAYCLGGNSPAVCTPSRNMLLSGNAYFRWKDFKPPQGQPGLLSPGDGPNFPLSMKAAGYETYHHGKRGNTAPLIQAKFDHNHYLMNDQAERNSGEPGKEIVDAAITFLNKRSGDRPFFMYLAFGNPHDPRVAAPKYLEQYQVDALPLPKNFQPLHPFDIGSNTIRDEALLPWPRTEADVRRTHHEYYATITAMDFHIGRLLARLKERGQLENTLVLFSADQGISIGSHGLLGKQNLYDAAMKSPLVFAGPGVPHGSSDALVYLLDIYPTVCDLVGAEVPSNIDGRSAKPAFANPKERHREELLLSYMATQRAIRGDRWKLIRYPQVDVTQLFDLQHDPDETRDLSNEADQAERVKDLLARMKAGQAKLGDTQPLTVPDPKPAAWTPPKSGS
jgi:arylsulfatase A-like enzyme